MAKKSFIDRGNPAMQFISAAREELPEKEEVRPASNTRSAEKKSRVTKNDKAADRERQGAQSVKSAQAVRAAAGDSAAAGNEATAVRSHPVAPRRQGESKSKRVQLLVPPSLHMKVSRRAAEMELSFNEYVNQLLEKSVDNN